jgi:hypothetical protein
MIHKSEWVISMADGFPLFHPPPWVGDRPLRNLIHRPDSIAHPIGPRPATPVARLDDLDPTPDLRCPVEEFSAFDPEPCSARVASTTAEVTDLDVDESGIGR